MLKKQTFLSEISNVKLYYTALNQWSEQFTKEKH